MEIKRDIYVVAFSKNKESTIGLLITLLKWCLLVVFAVAREFYFTL